MSETTPFPSGGGVNDVVLAGFGGQGILLAGRLLAAAAMNAGQNVLVHNYYEGFVRGGVSESTIVLSSGAIGSPVRRHPVVAAALDARAVTTWSERVRPGGMLLRNQPAAGDADVRDEVTIVDMPATELAQSTGNAMTVSMAVVGALAELTGWFTLEACIGALPDVVPPHRRALIAANEAALQLGAAFASARTGG